jgi:hypothetical protein|tara:strand:- start:3088 stop:3639 length:552 start_codon:yes stop_codon:yes gene_type:complete
MRKLLFVLGIGGIGYAVYNYFNKQLQLALDWEFKVKGFNILNISKDNAKLKLNLEILNKSNFNLLVKDYDLKIFYEGVEVGTAKSTVPFEVGADSWFPVPTVVDVNFKGFSSQLDDLGINILLGKPFVVDITGNMNVEYSKIKKKVILNVPDVVISKNVGDEIGISKPLNQINAFLENLGIKT